ncbi:hypothetical protein GMAR_ORF14 [Golden Marseillevirus]|uniref:hypothetical protein n=1 Tax=Golden Marseillevirus TaxID=1720526 RepID=UPI000877A95F|nr:hypothetical protein GMAR_ORF14 [Golden Marseillevirus]ALX27389.1 hypothetical protein GMAR_ORF14 [Golden Marseillevirus]
MQRQTNFFKDISVIGNVSVLPPVLAPGTLVYLTTDQNLYVSSGQDWVLAAGDVGPLANQVAQNTSDIAALETSVSGLQTSVTTLQGQTATNTSNIGTLQTQTSTNTSNITTLQGQTATNTSNITTLQGQVATNTSSIGTLQTQTSTNTSNITTLQGQVATNTSNISGNTASISTLQTQTSTNTSNITTLQGQTATNTTNISTNTSNITTLQGQVATNTSNITTLQSQTAALRVPRVISVLYATGSIPSGGFDDLGNLTTTAPSVFQFLQGYTPTGDAQMSVDTTNGFFTSSTVGAVFRYTVEVIFSEAAVAGEIRQLSTVSLRGTDPSQGSDIAIAGVAQASQRVSCIFYTFVESAGGYLVTFRIRAPNAGATRTITARIIVEQIQWG